MGKTLRFCFKIDKQVGMAEDENGNRCEAFSCCKAKGVPNYTVPKEKYQKAQEAYRKVLANKLGCDIEMIIPITLNEYLDETEDED